MEKYNFDDRKQLAEDILTMLKRGSSNDVKIKLSDGEINANKDILIARSDYFATMFSNDKFIEGETNKVDMSHCSKAVMERIIKFLFIGVVAFHDLSLPQLLELSHNSDMMLLIRFKDEVVNFVKSELRKCGLGKNKFNFQELILALKCAYQYKADPDIITLINEDLLYGLWDISNNEEIESFKTLPFNWLKDIFTIDSTYLFYLTTKRRFDSFIIWLSNNEATEDQKKEIVKFFDFEEFTVKELITSGLYPTSKIDERVLELFKNQGDLLKEKDKLIVAKDNLLKDQEKLLKSKDKQIKAQEKSFKDFKRKRIMDDFRV